MASTKVICTDGHDIIVARLIGRCLVISYLGVTMTSSSRFATSCSFVLLASISLAACTTTNETPITPNVVRLDTSASGLLFTGRAGQDTLKKAAQTTLAHGYQYFRFADVATGNGDRLAGVATSGQASIYGGPRYASVYGSSISSPIYAPTAQVGATVIMSNTNEEGSWNAAEVLARK